MSRITVFAVPVRLFDLGQVVATPGAIEACSPEHLQACLSRHVRGDWGNVCQDDWATNFEALTNGDRLLSAYAIDPDRPCKGYGANCLWIITEADRSVTTFLLPEEY
jgi:hypothetical protein